MARLPPARLIGLRSVKSVTKPRRTNAKQEPGDPYASGYDAALAGSPETFNPYDEGTRDWAQWRDGWRASREGVIV